MDISFKDLDFNENSSVTSFRDLNNITFNNHKIAIVLDDDNKPWYDANDVTIILKCLYPNKAIQQVKEKYKKKLYLLKPSNNLTYNQKNTIYINKQGLESLLKSKKL